jgi:hypothetical protein
MLAAAFLVTAVVPLALFYGLDFRVTDIVGSCEVLRSDTHETSSLWAWLAFAVGPLSAGVIAYVAVVLLAPRGLGRTRWRFAIGVPVAAAIIALLFLAAAAGFLIYPSCPD